MGQVISLAQMSNQRQSGREKENYSAIIRVDL